MGIMHYYFVRERQFPHTAAAYGALVLVVNDSQNLLHFSRACNV